MQSRIAEELKLRYQPVAILLADEKPGGATQFGEGKWGCVAAMHVAASKGRTVVFDRKTYGCAGGGVGVGFGDRYATDFPEIAGYLSTGAESRGGKGEGYWKDRETAQAFVDSLPYTDVPAEYVVFRPLDAVDEAAETPQLVCFYANPDQLSALVVLANYGRKTPDNVAARMGAGCHSICLFALEEAERDPQRAVIGMFDITARSKVDPDLLSFSVPWAMFLEMEGNVEGSFLQKHDWQRLRDRSGK